VTIDKRNQNNGFDPGLTENLESDALLKQNCHPQNMKRTIIYGAKFNLSSSLSNHTVDVLGVEFLSSDEEN
jgi:hypothetical protein